MQDWRAKLGRNVRRLRHPRGLTQEQLAFEAEIDLTYVGGIERGRRNPSLMVLARIACGGRRRIGIASADATAGEAVFKSAGCSGCHTLKAAGATGTVGPNLDQLKPPLSKVVTQVLNGGAQMPPFKGQLSDKQIADVAAFVVKSTGGDMNG